MMQQDSAGVRSVERAFVLLRAIAGQTGTATVSDIARESGLPKSTVVRLLATMEGIGVVERMAGNGGYRLGSALGALTAGGASPGEITSVARPYLLDLVDELGEDAGLAVPDGDQVLYVDQVQCAHPVQVQNWTGARFPLHTVAAGYVLLAGWGEEDIGRYVSGPLQRFTEATLTDSALIRKRIEEVRRNGFAWTVDEFAEGISGAAAPIYDAGGKVVAAINLYGPTYRLPSRKARDLGERVREAGEKVSGRFVGE